MKRTLITKRVPKAWFMVRMLRLEKTIRNEVKDVMYFNKDYIDHFEFGRIPKHRLYRIFTDEGTIFEWNVTR